MMFCFSDTFKEAFAEMSRIDFGWLNVEKMQKGGSDFGFMQKCSF